MARKLIGKNPVRNSNHPLAVAIQGMDDLDKRIGKRFGSKRKHLTHAVMISLYVLGDYLQDGMIDGSLLLTMLHIGAF